MTAIVQHDSVVGVWFALLLSPQGRVLRLVEARSERHAARLVAAWAPTP